MSGSIKRKGAYNSEHGVKKIVDPGGDTVQVHWDDNTVTFEKKENISSVDAPVETPTARK